MHLTETGKELKNESIEFRPWYFNISDKTLKEV